MKAAHAWQPRGTMDDGTRRYVCATCGVGKTWPEAEAKCGAIAAEERVDAEAVRSTRWRKPFAAIVVGAVPNRVCGVCAAEYHSKHGASRYCSPACARKAWNLRHAELERAATAAKRAAKEAAT